jgi:Mg2+ and Co2+ transporter CorA
LFLIAHFHRAALLVFSDRLVDAVHDLDIRLPESVHRFRQRIHDSFEAFLRFTHRYWFHEVSERAHIQALYRLLADRLGARHLYDEVKDELRDMSQYLDSDAQRRQSTTVVRLTVVTTFSLVGTVATGFLGMNIIAEADAPVAMRWTYFLLALLGTGILTIFTVVKSKELSDMMDMLSDERLSFRQRLGALGRAWGRKERT